MGKNSLIKSTTKKKTTAAKKKDATKKVKAAAAEKPKTKTTPKAKAVAKKKAPAKTKKPAAKTKKTATAKPKTRKAEAPKKVSIHDLIMKRFDPWQPDRPYQAPDLDQGPHFSAPPFFPGKEKEDLQRLKNILFRQFHLTVSPEKTPSDDDLPKEEALPPKDDPAHKETLPPSIDAPSIETRLQAEPKASDPMGRMVAFGGIVFALLIALIIGASFQNQSKFYIKATNGAVDIWQGKFSPMGEQLLISLPGAIPPESIKPVYAEKEALTLAFDFYIEKADALLNVSGMPDFKGIKSYLQKALSFAASEDLRSTALKRLNTIDLMILLYKADVSAGKGTLADLENSLEALEAAATMQINPVQSNMIQQRIDDIKREIADSKLKQAAEAAAAEKSETK